jgi:hypothetical protein
MKTIMLSVCLIFSALALPAQDYGLYWKYKDYTGVAFSLPGFAIEIGAWFIEEKEERAFVQQVNKVRVLYFEGYSPVTEKDLKKFDRKAGRKGLEDMIYVRHGKMHARILVKERKNVIRKIVVLVQSPDEFALVTVKGRLHLNDLGRLIDEYGKEPRKDGKPVVPPEVKIPVIKI